jgi:hypothetical protein
MSRLIGSLLALLVCGATAPALADDAPDVSPFGEAAGKAQHVRSLDRVVWSLTASCEQGDDLSRRQCRVLRDAAAARYKGATLLVDVTGEGAFVLDAYDNGAKAAPLTLRGCVDCAGVEVDGKKWVVVANKAAPKVSGGKIEAVALHETVRQFKDEAAATTWRTTIVPQLRTQMLVKIPADKKLSWQQGDVQGLAFEVVGFRVYDACDGQVLFASPEANAIAPNTKACGKTAEVKDTGPAEVIVAELTKEQVLAGLKPALAEAKACYDQFNEPGDAKVKVTISGDGVVIALEQSGDFVGKPTGECIEKAINKATFPKSKKAKTTISYPIGLH